MLFVIAGPSGVGKSYLIQQLLKRYPDQFVSPKLLTTRQPRPGEQAVDRAFITKSSFDELKNVGAFAFAGEFNGNWYGYTHDAVKSSNKHILVNAWPAMLDQLQHLPEVVIIGLSIDGNNLDMLKQRIIDRGDPLETLDGRMERVVIDLNDLKARRAMVAEHGQMFEIGDDTAIEASIKWLVDTHLTEVAKHGK